MIFEKEAVCIKAAFFVNSALIINCFRYYKMRFLTAFGMTTCHEV